MNIYAIQYLVERYGEEATLGAVLADMRCPPVPPGEGDRALLPNGIRWVFTNGMWRAAWVSPVAAADFVALYPNALFEKAP